jgi:hypothetical protein
LTLGSLQGMSSGLVDLLHRELKLYDPTMLNDTLHGRAVNMHIFERPVELAKHTAARECVGHVWGETLPNSLAGCASRGAPASTCDEW